METYIIIEYNGLDYITFALDNYGEVKMFNSEKEAEEYAAEYLAFNYKIVRLY